MGINTAVLVLLLGGHFLYRGIDADALAASIRITARTSVSLFLPAFAASALHALVPAWPTRWLLANRRYLGVSFGVSHLVHALAILSLALYTDGVSLAGLGALNYVPGGVVYLFILFMVLTSFDRTAALVGRRVWKAVHTTGAWLIWFSFALGYAPRLSESLTYAVPVSLLFLAVILRVVRAVRFRGGG